MRVLLAIAICTGCAGEPSDRLQTRFELHGPATVELREPQVRFYTTYLDEVERWLDAALPPIQLYETAWPRDCAAPWCVRNGAVVVLCHDLQRECMLALATAIVDHMATMPLVLRDGLADALAGGLAHGDHLDSSIARDGFDLAAMLDDGRYTMAKAQAYAVAGGDLAWLHATVYPAGELTRFVVDRLGPRNAIAAMAGGDWQALGGIDAVLAGWRAQPARTGRAYRYAFAECSEAYALASELPVMVQGVAFAPDLDQAIDRFGVGSFDIAAQTDLDVTVVSAIAGQPFVRLEGCGADPTATTWTYTNATAIVEHASVAPGRYFILAGSDRVPTPTLGEAVQPEPVWLTAVSP